MVWRIKKIEKKIKKWNEIEWVKCGKQIKGKRRQLVMKLF